MMFDQQQPAAMPWMNMQPMKKGGGMQDMGMKILQAALSQQKNDQARLAAQPQPGQVMPGGAMNITPATLPNAGGAMGLLGNLFRRMGPAGGAMPGPMDSTNALY